MQWDRRYLAQIDWVIVVALLGLVTAGLIVIASAAHTMPGGEFGYILRQSISAIAGLLTWVVVMGLHYVDLARLRWWFYGITLAMLTAVMVVGHSALGAQRWLKIGPIQFQPSEPAKLFMIIALAAFLADRPPLKRWVDLIPPGLFIAVPMLLIIKQPDLGTSLVLLTIAAFMFYMAGAPGWRIVLIVGGAIGIVSFWIYAHRHWGYWIPLHDYQINRLIIFLDPTVDPLDTGYHVLQSRIAIGTGGLFGQGWYHGRMTQLGFLPEAHTDFIFASLVEEFGFLGGMVVLVLFMIVLYRLLARNAEVEDRFGHLIVAGVVGFLFFQVVVNVGMTMSVMPVTGVPLPFVSYGPSAMLTNFATMGLALGVLMRRKVLVF